LFRRAGVANFSDRDDFRPECLNTAVLQAVQHAVTIAADDSQIFGKRPTSPSWPAAAVADGEGGE
jgi:hypothetical protein